MDAIELLERRIAALELEVLPLDNNLDVDKSQLITDLLLQTHSMTTTALSCREVISTILNRMETINSFVNPTFCETQLDVENKKQYMLELYPEMQKTLQLVAEFDCLKGFLDSPAIANIPTLVSKLEQLTLSNSGVYDECREVTNKIFCALQQYNDITTSIKMLFAQLEQSVMAIELSLDAKSITN